MTIVRNAINLRANYDYRVMPAKWVNEQRYSRVAEYKSKESTEKDWLMTLLK